MNSTERGRQRLLAAGARLPDDGDLLRASELVERYLLPLSRLEELRGSVREGSRVTHVGREGLSKRKAIAAPGDERREHGSFLLRVEDRGGVARFERADTVIDASGVISNPNATGPGGLPAIGESEVEDRIDRHLPCAVSQAAARYGGRSVLLLGDGHSAATALCMLDHVARTGGATPRVDWIHRDRGGEPFARATNDPLPARSDLVRRANRIAGAAPWLTRHPGATVTSYEAVNGRVLVTFAEQGGVEVRLDVDRVLALVGYRPDLEITRELQVHHCYATEGTMRLASAIQSASLAAPERAGDCLSQVAHGPESLRNPEPRFFVLGAKSYGRNPSFLLDIGHRQVRDAFTLIGKPRETRAPHETAPSNAS
jgi:hypothetical protein